MQYSYDDGDLYHFMDTETWEETLVAHDNVGDAFKFVKEEMMCKISSYKGKILGVELPIQNPVLPATQHRAQQSPQLLKPARP